jgi:hypothetical protein
MEKHKVITTDAEISAAIARGQDAADEPRVVAVEYRAGSGLDLLILKMNDGHRVCIPREDLQGLNDAPKQDVAKVEILGQGTGLHWPTLDIDLYVPALLNQVYGTRRWMARLGHRGGSATSAAKAKAAKENGAKGGRPKRRLSTAQTVS